VLFDDLMFKGEIRPQGALMSTTPRTLDAITVRGREASRLPGRWLLSVEIPCRRHCVTDGCTLTKTMVASARVVHLPPGGGLRRRGRPSAGLASAGRKQAIVESLLGQPEWRRR
jgi:hypothetical protein